MKLELINGDCMDVMKDYPDDYFDLAVVDPPYGIGMDSNRASQKGKYGYKQYKETNWDNSAPDKGYFEELVRVSRNHIIWGANHFISKTPHDSPCWLVWDKNNGDNDNADCELAITTFKTAVRKFTLHISSTFKHRIHPTQKPVKLYDWIYHNYAEEGQKILDTHLGSGSNAIAAHYAKMGEFVGIELDEDYFKAAQERIQEQTRQQELF